MTSSRVLGNVCLVAMSLSLLAMAPQTPAPRLVRSVAGPSGVLRGAQFVVEDVRNRFVYPQDRSLTIYFEWEFTPGEHVLTATWRQPDGRIVSVSPDVKVQTTTSAVNCYWIFGIAPTLAAGTWSVEIRIDGQPAGSHAFELAGVDPAGGRMTLDEVFKKYAASIVRIHRMDETGRRMDIGTGFVLAPNAVATAFQVVDSATTLEVEFSDGRRVPTVDTLAVSRLGDWAVLRVDTASLIPVPVADQRPVPVGARLAFFDESAGTRGIEPVDVTAASSFPGYGGRIRVTTAVSRAAVGGPLIDERGSVVGILGGSLNPGSRLGQRVLTQYPELDRGGHSNLATAVADVRVESSTHRTLGQLKSDAVLTPALEPMPELVTGGTTSELSKDAADRRFREVAEFSSREHSTIAVYTYWIKRAKVSKGEVSAAIFDADNRRVGSIAPKKISLKGTEQRFSFALPVKGIPPGRYRIDTYFDGRPVWRNHVQVTD